MSIYFRHVQEDEAFSRKRRRRFDGNDLVALIGVGLFVLVLTFAVVAAAVFSIY